MEYKEINDLTLKTDDFVMVHGILRRIIHITHTDGLPKGIIVQPEKDGDNAMLAQQEAEVCRKILMEYVKELRRGTAQPSPEIEAYLHRCFPEKYLGGGQFVGIENT